MLAPRTSSAFVCLRCEAQLARPRIPASARRANFSASARCRDGSAELEALLQAQEGKLKIKKEVQPLNRIRRSKGQVLRETSARLGGITRLGQDADVLVLREVWKPEREEQTPTPAPEEHKPAHVPLDVPNLVASLQHERKDLTPEEINTQIESLRPKNDGDPSEPRYVTQTTFVKLIRLLTSGFTQQQLSGYYSAAKHIKPANVFKEVIDGFKSETGNRRVERTEWQPGTTSSYKRLPGLVAARSKRKLVSKQLLVDRILRDAWKLVLLEEIEAPGELELTLKPWQISLLKAGGKESILDKIVRTRRAKFEIYRQYNVIRITASKTTAEYAAEDIEEVLQNAAWRKMNLRSWLPLLEEGTLPKDAELQSLFSQSDLDVVSRLTRTNIAWTGNTYVIRGLESSAVAEAERTLLRFLPLRDPTTRTIDTQKVDAARASSDLLPVYLDSSSLDYAQRQKSYARHSLPITRLSESHTQDAQLSTAETADDTATTSKATHGLVNRTVATLKRPNYKEGQLTEEVGHWYPEPDYKVSAEIGQVLFPIDEKPSKKKTTPQSSRAIFSPTFPGLSRILTADSFQAHSRLQTPYLTYDFVAAPNQPDFQPGRQFPSLQIRMRTGSNGTKPSLHKLNISFRQRVHDVLLPNQAADIRFQRHARLRLRKDHTDANVQAWTDAVIANIESGGRLSAPNITIDVPTWTIPGEAPDAKGTRSVTYLFSGIQFGQGLTAHLLDTRVSYRTVQSGKLGKKQGVLAAHFIEDLRDEEKLRMFVEGVWGIVGMVSRAAGETEPVRVDRRWALWDGDGESQGAEGRGVEEEAKP